MNLDELVATARTGCSIDRAAALALLAADNAETLRIVAAAGQVRRHFFGRRVRLNYLVNLKSGLCPEDCHYCSQAAGSTAEILRYGWLSPEEITAAVEWGVARGAGTVCLVASGRGPSRREVDRVAEVVAGIRRTHPDVKICACLGFLDEDKAATLVAAGADRYNHNLNTAAERYPDICSSHTFADRVATVRAATAAGLSPCSGVIVGLGESDAELVDAAYALRDLGVDSVPVNFLLPFEGTPLGSGGGAGGTGAGGGGGAAELTPLRCLKVLAMVRFVHPDREVRCAAGREYHLRSLQPLALEVCSSIFLGDYLTSEGQAAAADLAMITDLGFEVERSNPGAGEVCWGHDQDVLAAAGGVALRRRGPGA